jgi:hypothetical protein
MASDSTVRRYRRWYARLLRFYSRPFRERFAESMEQTFSDLLRERQGAGESMLSFVLWVFAETSAGIVRENLGAFLPRNRNIVAIAVATVCILAIPLVAMQFTEEVAWSPGDFVVAGALLFGTGVAIEIGVRRMESIAYRAGVGAVLVSALLLVWVNLAVGIIGSENERANVMYLGVIAVGMTGAAIARLRPHGMVRAVAAMAVAQAGVAGIALAARMDRYPESSVLEILGVNGFFIALFLGSAFLFQRAAVGDR